MSPFYERLLGHTCHVLRGALSSSFGELEAELLPEPETLALPPDPKMGEFAYPCFALAKKLRKAPLHIAQELAKNLSYLNDPWIDSASAAGPYVNLSVKRAECMTEILAEISHGGADFGQTARGVGKTVVVDFSSPNIAKHLAFHHLRSTVIGNSLCEIYRTLGYKTVGINHLGDWGTQFGKLIVAYQRWGPKNNDLGADPIVTLNDLYVRFQKESQTDEALLDEARAWFKKLEDGDATAKGLWQRFRTVSLEMFERVYRRLGIRFDEVSGESTYLGEIPALLSEIDQKNLSKRSEGALIVDLTAYDMPPCLLKKADEASLYATRDLCAAVSRAKRLKFDRMLYVVDAGQSLHFRQVFKVLALMNYDWAAKVEHVPFGIIKFAGSKTRTREGNIILLEEVLDEAAGIIRQKITEKNPNLTDPAEVAEAVGVGAIIFADLSGRRVKDINFDWNEILNFDGRTGPYVQYSHARACSILRKGGITAPLAASSAKPALLTTEAEWAVALQLARYPSAIVRAGNDAEPSYVADQLLDICESFHRYHTSGKINEDKRVLTDNVELRQARLLLTDCTRQVLANGLRLLGMKSPAAM